MFRRKAIDEWALDYWLLQSYAKLCFRIYYRKVEVVNKNRIPLNQPVILAPNHQNALMDAMVLVCKTQFQNVFLARADIFKGKRMTRFLTFLNIMPIYRMRDGIENVKRNDQVFEKTLQVLHNMHNPLGLFAEGNHGDKRRLRPLVKGLFRIGLQAQEKYGNLPAVKIIPVGIDYGHYQHFRSTLFVNVGEPIEVSSFNDTYRENPVLAINQLKDSFASALSRQMIDIQTEEFYDLYMHLREIFNDEMREELGIRETTLASKFRADKAMIELLNKELDQNPDNMGSLNMLVADYQKSVRKAGLRDWVIRKQPFSIPGIGLSVLTKLLLLPVFLFGFLNNWLPYQFTGSRVKNIKDTQFHSSFKYVIGMIAFPLWYLVLAVIVAFLGAPAWTVLLYVILLPVTGLAAFRYYICLKKLLAKIRFTLFRNNPEMMHLKNTRNIITGRMHDLIKRQKT
ncbi:MAG: 1-acyl-sn-glycerol-3-phosphate acyltransferase [Bacteroidales bacterium]|nr:1-acyl-sn-glycerol-3-phosphate acyltransferase [Bacteroidales bacterium]